MKLIYRITLAFSAVFMLHGCGGESSSTKDPSSEMSSDAPAGKESIAEEIPFDKDAIYVERMYATSTGNKGPEYLLDGDASSNWDAMQGAGPNEGVMLYFEKPVEVGSIQVKSQGADNDIKQLECFVNGATKGKLNLNEEKQINESVQSMFVKVAQVKRKESIEFGDYPICTITKYPEGLQVELGEIEFKDKAGNPLKMRPLHLDPGVVVATSTLEPKEAYNADFLFDSNLEFGWAEGKEDEGIGEKVQITFDRPIRVEKIKIWNGYQRSDRHFKRNARAKNVTFGSMGQEGNEFTLSDEQGGQILDLPEPIEGNEFELVVNDFYAGESYTDLVLSEMRFFDGQQWFGVGSQEFESRKMALTNRVSGTFLADLIDRPLAEFQDMEMEGEVSYNLTLRTSGSFVLYRTRSEGENSTEKRTEIREVADGNWSIESLDKSKEVAKVKIFGKLNRIMEKEYWYKGKSKTDFTRIFSEILTITPDLIKGQKLIDEMHINAPLEDGKNPTGQIAPDKEKETQFAYPGSEVYPSFQVTLEG